MDYLPIRQISRTMQLVVVLVLGAAGLPDRVRAADSCETASPEKLAQSLDRLGKPAVVDHIVRWGQATEWTLAYYAPDLTYRVVPQSNSGESNGVSASVQSVAKTRLDTQDATTLAVSIWPSVAKKRASASRYVWTTQSFIVAGCDSTQTIKVVAHVQVMAVSKPVPFLLSILVVAALYSLAALAWQRRNRPDGPITWNPLEVTAGISGASSISNLQIMYFTLIVVGIVVYAVLTSGRLLDLSTGILYLLGISGLGTAGAKFVASRQSQLDPVNLRWMRNRGWLTRTSTSTPTSLLMTGNELSLTRFQLLAVSLVIGLSLLLGSPVDVETFAIPEGVLGLLAASQTVYVGGKFVMRRERSESAVAALNDKIAAAMKLERELSLLAPAGIQTTAAKSAWLSTHPRFGELRQLGQAAADEVTRFFDLEAPPTTLIWGVPFARQRSNPILEALKS